jgi:NADPH:quinone reductase
MHILGPIRCGLNSSDPNFPQDLFDVCQRCQPRIAFDSVAGPLTLQLLTAMPSHSKVIVYGALSHEPAQAGAAQLIFQGKSVAGFWLPAWIAKKNFVQSLLFWQRAQKLMAVDLRSAVRRQYPLAEAQKAVKDYQSQMTGGKILLIPARDGV